MKIKYLLYIPFFALSLNIGCSKEKADPIDTEYPVIDLSAANASPKQCAVLKRGENLIFRARLSDNVKLGSVNVDIHHNFDHHTHSTEVASCQMEAIKTPVKPFLLIKSYPIEAGSKSYEINQTIAIPSDIDAGDYHFMIRLTDTEGWQTIKGVSIKINN